MLRSNHFIVSLLIILSFTFFLQSNANADANSVDLDGVNLEPFIQTKSLTGERLQGYALKQPVSVYSNPSRESIVLKNYNYNHSLIYYPYSSNWYVATVYLYDGIAYRGYIHKDDVGDHSNASSVRGVALNQTNVYSSRNTKSSVLKSYSKGSILKYRSYNKDWYIATVYVNGIRHTGYISAKDVETAATQQQVIRGVGTKKTTKVYARASTNSKVLKSYKEGQILKYRTFSRNWYEATVYVNGTRQTGYISARDVDTITDNQQRLRGIGIKSPTRVYSLASKDSKTLRSYPAGHVLIYRTFSNHWYEATVYINGKAHTGYISKQDIEPISSDKQKTLQGVGVKQPTRVYSLASKNSKALKSYRYGHLLKFRTLSSHWYEATVYINGKPQTGYISKHDVNTNLNSRIQGYASVNSTAVYSNTSRNSKVLKRYKKGHLLQFRPYNNNWFQATVYVNGKAQSGFINTSDVSPHAPNLRAPALKNPTHVYSAKSRSSSVLKSYKRGQVLQFRPYNSSWYEATVYVKGKAHTGYIHVNDVGQQPNKEEKAQGFDIPILMYHQVGDDPQDHEYRLYVSEENFREQMMFLKSEGYTPIFFEDFPNIKNIKKPIIITFDDGRENNMIAYNVLKELNDDDFQAKATFFIIGSKVNAKTYLSEEQIREISDSGIISIQSHTMTHPHFNDNETSHNIDLTYQLEHSKKLLEELTGKKVTALAYPYGAYNDKIIEETKKYYDYAVSTRPGIANTTDSPYDLKRVRVSYDTTLEQFKKSIGFK